MSDKTRTITLTDRPPVKITEDNWPVIAEGRDDWYEGEFAGQANRSTDRSVRARRNADGRVIVYAVHDHMSKWVDESGLTVRHGELVNKAETPDIIEAIHGVCDRMHGVTGDIVWQRLAHECIADLPAETI
jgi:hypothetical protein